MNMYIFKFYMKTVYTHVELPIMIFITSCLQNKFKSCKQIIYQLIINILLYNI